MTPEALAKLRGRLADVRWMAQPGQLVESVQMETLRLMWDVIEAVLNDQDGGADRPESKSSLEIRPSGHGSPTG